MTRKQCLVATPPATPPPHSVALDDDFTSTVSAGDTSHRQLIRVIKAIPLALYLSLQAYSLHRRLGDV